jgi:hypothetical protein
MEKIKIMKRDLGRPLASTYGDDPKKKKDKTLDVSPVKKEPQRTFDFQKSEPKKSSGLKANPFLTDAEAKSKRAALGKSLRTGKIDAKTYKKEMSMSLTAGDIKRREKNAGGSGVKNKRGGSCMKAETRSRSCSKPGKGF